MVGHVACTASSLVLPCLALNMLCMQHPVQSAAFRPRRHLCKYYVLLKLVPRPSVVQQGGQAVQPSLSPSLAQIHASCFKVSQHCYLSYIFRITYLVQCIAHTLYSHMHCGILHLEQANAWYTWQRASWCWSMWSWCAHVQAVSCLPQVSCHTCSSVRSVLSDLGYSIKQK